MNEIAIKKNKNIKAKPKMIIVENAQFSIWK